MQCTTPGVVSLVCVAMAGPILGCQATGPRATDRILRVKEPSERRPQASYILGELIVKLTPEAGEQLEAALAAKRAPSDTGLDWLDRLNQRYGVTKLEPVFTHQPDVEAITRKFPQRSKRAPPGAAVPSLKYIYKLTLSASAPIPQAVSDYASQPSIEYAHPNYLATTQPGTGGLPSRGADHRQ